MTEFRRTALASVLIAVMLCASACHHKEKDKDREEEHHKAAAPPPPTVSVGVAVRRTIQETIELVGTVAADNPINLGPQVSGRVTQVLGDVGTPVRRGQLVVVLDDYDLQLQLLQDKASLQEQLALVGLQNANQKLVDKTAVPAVKKAKAVVENQKYNYESYVSMREQNLVSAQQVSNAKQSYLSAQADYQTAIDTVEQNLAAVKMAKIKCDQDLRQITYTRVYSPVDGIVQQRNVSPGDSINAGQSALVIADLSRLYVTITVPEMYSRTLLPGRLLKAVTQTAPPVTLMATVAEISPVVNPQDRTITAKATLGYAPGLVRPGTFCKVKYFTGRKFEKVLLPQAAILTDAGVSRAFRLHHERDRWEVRDTVISLGQPVGSWIEVNGDIKVGDEVAASDLAALQSGLVVKPGRRLQLKRTF